MKSQEVGLGTKLVSSIRNFYGRYNLSTCWSVSGTLNSLKIARTGRWPKKSSLNSTANSSHQETRQNLLITSSTCSTKIKWVWIYFSHKSIKIWLLYKFVLFIKNRWKNDKFLNEFEIMVNIFEKKDIFVKITIQIGLTLLYLSQPGGLPRTLKLWWKLQNFYANKHSRYISLSWVIHILYCISLTMKTPTKVVGVHDSS